MKTRIIFFAIILLSLNILAQNAQIPKLFLLNKSYAQKLFKPDDFQKLQTFYKSEEQSNKFWQKYDKYNSKAQQYNVKKIPVPKNKQRRYNKKYIKLKKKAVKFGNKALDFSVPAINGIERIYERKAKTLKIKTKDNDVKYIVGKLKTENTALNKKIKTLKNKISKTNDEQKLFDVRRQLYLTKKQKLLNYEYLFAISMSDSTVIKNLKNKYLKNKPKKPKSNLDTFVFVRRYNWKADKNLFSPIINDSVLNKKINFSISEKNLIFEAQTKIFEGNRFFDTGDSARFIASKLMTELQKTKNPQKFKTLKGKIDKLNKQAKENYIKGWNSYINANKLLYNAYNEKIALLLATQNNPQAKQLHDSAVQFFVKAEKMQSSAKGNLKVLPLVNKKYLFANLYLVNAFKAYFGQNYKPIASLPKVQKYVPPKVQPATQGKKQDSTQNKKPDRNKNKKPKKKVKPKIVYLGLYTYSSTQRTPVKVRETGTYYRVYVGESAGLLPVTEIPEYEPYYYEKYSGKKTKSFYVGKFRSYDEAAKAAKELKAKGYPAKVVTFVNGKKATGKVIVAGCDTQPSNDGNVTKVTQPAISYPEITDTKYLIYAIQIGTFSSPKTKQQLKNLSPIYQTTLPDGRIQYFLAPIYSYTDALNKLQVVKNKGFSDALIVAYNNGKKISLQKARQIEAAVKKQNQVVFRVQIGAFSKKLSQGEINSKFGKIAAVYPIYTHTKNGLYVYSAGDASSFDEAKTIRDKIRSMGFTDAYIIAFKGGKEVPLSQVLKK